MALLAWPRLAGASSFALALVVLIASLESAGAGEHVAAPVWSSSESWLQLVDGGAVELPTEQNKTKLLHELRTQVAALRRGIALQKEEIRSLKHFEEEQAEATEKKTVFTTSLAVSGGMVMVNGLFVVMNMWRRQRKLMWPIMKETVSIFCAVLLYQFVNVFAEMPFLLRVVFNVVTFLGFYGLLCVWEMLWTYLGTRSVQGLGDFARWIDGGSRSAPGWLGWLLPGLHGAADGAQYCVDEALDQVRREHREERPLTMMVCGLLLAHTCGFTCIDGMGMRLEKGGLLLGLVPMEFDAWYKTLVFMIEMAVIYTVVFHFFIYVRDWVRDRVLEGIIAGQKKKKMIDKFDEVMEDAENDILGLTFAYLFTVMLRQAVCGRRPEANGADSLEELEVIDFSGSVVLHAVAVVCFFLAVFVQVYLTYSEKEKEEIKQLKELEELHSGIGSCLGTCTLEMLKGVYRVIHHADAAEKMVVKIMKRLPDIVLDFATMSCAWCLLSGQTWFWHWTNLAQNEMHILRLVVAIAVTVMVLLVVAFWGAKQNFDYAYKGGATGVVAVIGLVLQALGFQATFEKWSRRWTKKQAVLVRKSRSTLEKVFGFLLGFTWEACFDDAVDGLVESTEHEPVASFVIHSLSPFIIVLLIGIWAKILVPNVTEYGFFFGFVPRKKVEQCSLEMCVREGKEAYLESAKEAFMKIHEGLHELMEGRE